MAHTYLFLFKRYNVFHLLHFLVEVTYIVFSVIDHRVQLSQRRNGKFLRKHIKQQGRNFLGIGPNTFNSILHDLLLATNQFTDLRYGNPLGFCPFYTFFHLFAYLDCSPLCNCQNRRGLLRVYLMLSHQITHIITIVEHILKAISSKLK